VNSSLRRKFFEKKIGDEPDRFRAYKLGLKDRQVILDRQGFKLGWRVEIARDEYAADLFEIEVAKRLHPFRGPQLCKVRDLALTYDLNSAVVNIMSETGEGKAELLDTLGRNMFSRQPGFTGQYPYLKLGRRFFDKIRNRYFGGIIFQNSFQETGFPLNLCISQLLGGNLNTKHTKEEKTETTN
jgi:hypothetical protein